MSKRAEEKAELIANGIMISVQGRTGRVVYNTAEKSFNHYDLMSAAQRGYEQAEKDTIERAVNVLINLPSLVIPSNYIAYFRKKMMEEDNG